MATFAIFELTTIACRRPFSIFSLPTITGAPGRLLRVKTPAAEHSHSDAINPKSNEASLIPRFIPSHENPQTLLNGG